MTSVRGWLNKAPDVDGSQPTWCLRAEVRTMTHPGLRAATARIVGDLNSVLVLMVATTLPPGALRSCARRRTWKASGGASFAARVAPALPAGRSSTLGGAPSAAALLAARPAPGPAPRPAS